MPTFRQASSTDEVLTAQRENKKAVERQLNGFIAELCSYACNVRTTVTGRFLVVNNESAVFVFFLGREKEK